jgi:hypothetical protein
MSDKETVSFEVGYRLLEEELANSTLTPKVKPKTVMVK